MDLIVGGGLLSRALEAHLTDLGRPYRLLTREPATAAGGPAAAPAREVVEGDANATKTLPGALAGIAAVFFATPIAALAERPGDWNATPFLAACAAAGVHLVLPVDMSLYEARGNPPYDEKSEIAGRGPLGQAQIEWENQATVEGLRRRFAVTVLRMPALLGPELTDPTLREAIARARASEPIVVTGRGEEVVEALAVADAARACVLAARRPEARGQTVNIPGHPIRRRNLLRVLVKVAGSRSEVVSAPARAARGRAGQRGDQGGPPRDFWVRGDTAKRLLGFSPAIPYDAAFRASL